MRMILCGWVLLGIVLSASSQQLETRNVVVVTLDGYRWQELFEGADQRILRRHRFRSGLAMNPTFCKGNDFEKRKALMPFMWTTAALRGQLYGNRQLGNKVNCSNWHLLSYPGYNEMLAGYADPRIRSNRSKNNPNITVLEMLNNKPELENDVAAFSTWNAFPFILRENVSDIMVNSGSELSKGKISPREKWLNEHPEVVFNSETGARHDEYTFEYALEFMKRKRPRVVMISFNETDEYGHAGKYDRYLGAAHKADSLIGVLWKWIQTEPDYQDQTTLIITTDHGRGKGVRSWRKHKMIIPSSRQTWLAVLGPDTPPTGEVTSNATLYQKQIARTIATFMGEEFNPHGKKPGKVLVSAFKPEVNFLLSRNE